MSPLIILWIASGLGGVLFLGCGFLVARATRWAEGAIPDVRATDVEADLRHTQWLLATKNLELQGLAASAERSALELHDACARAIGERSQFEKECARLSAACSRLEAENTRVESELWEADAERVRLKTEQSGQLPSLQRLRELGAENARLLAQARVNDRKSDTPAALAEQRDTMARLRSQCDKMSTALERMRKLAEHVPALRSQIEEARRSLSEATQGQTYWQRRARALEVELAYSKRALADAAQPAAEPAPLESLVVPMPSRVSGIRPSPSAALLRGTQQGPQTLESNLERHLVNLVAGEPDVVAVLSDDDGFPLVGLGPDSAQEGLAVLTSLAHSLASRAGEFAGLEHIELMEMADTTGRAVRVRFFQWEGQALALGHVGRRRLSASADEEQLVSDFPEVLLQAQSA